MTTPDNTADLRHKILLKMLSKCKNANECGDLTVVPLGFAVDVALSLLSETEAEADRKGREDQLKWATILLESRSADLAIKAYRNRLAELRGVQEGKDD